MYYKVYYMVLSYFCLLYSFINLISIIYVIQSTSPLFTLPSRQYLQISGAAARGAQRIQLELLQWEEDWDTAGVCLFQAEVQTICRGVRRQHSQVCLVSMQWREMLNRAGSQDRVALGHQQTPISFTPLSLTQYLHCCQHIFTRFVVWPSRGWEPSVKSVICFFIWTRR